MSWRRNTKNLIKKLLQFKLYKSKIDIWECTEKIEGVCFNSLNNAYEAILLNHLKKIGKKKVLTIFKI